MKRIRPSKYHAHVSKPTIKTTLLSFKQLLIQPWIQKGLFLLLSSLFILGLQGCGQLTNNTMEHAYNEMGVDNPNTPHVYQLTAGSDRHPIHNAPLTFDYQLTNLNETAFSIQLTMTNASDSPITITLPTTPFRYDLTLLSHDQILYTTPAKTVLATLEIIVLQPGESRSLFTESMSMSQNNSITIDAQFSLYVESTLITYQVTQAF